VALVLNTVNEDLIQCHCFKTDPSHVFEDNCITSAARNQLVDKHALCWQRKVRPIGITVVVVCRCSELHYNHINTGYRFTKALTQIVKLRNYFLL